MIVIRDPKTFFLLLIGLNMLIRIWSMKLNYHKKPWILPENKIKKEIEQLLLKYKHGNNTYEQETLQNEWTT